MNLPPTADVQQSLDSLHAAARDIFAYSLEHCNIGEAFDRHMHFEGTTLVHHPYPGLQKIIKPARIPLADFRNIRIIAFGNAAVPMLDALIARLPPKLSYRAICASPGKQHHSNWRIKHFAAGHPRPNQESFNAARAALRMLSRAKASTFVFFLISGGGSAMLELPLNDGISLDDTIAFHEELILSGATIHEINVIRKHFSAVKGGRLALAAPLAAKLTLQIADVPLRSLDALASGPTIPDRSTIEECREILHRYHLLDRFPATIRAYFAAAHLEETPGNKPAYALSSLPANATAALRAVLRPMLRVETTPEASGFGSLDTLLSSHDLVNAARDRAQELGFKVIIDNTCDDWDYADAALYLTDRLQQLRVQHPRLCLISGGEVTVKVVDPPGGKTGTGGRNQQFALAAALSLAKQPAQITCVFSAGTDGVDGNSPVAGAIADSSTVSRAAAHQFSVEDSLASFDACPLFSALGDTVVTGPTGHNLRDLRLLLCSPKTAPLAPAPAVRESFSADFQDS
jgi:glycerate 2-kinase